MYEGIDVFWNLETYSQISLSKWKAWLHIFCSQNYYVQSVYQSAWHHLPSLKSALHCALCQCPVPDSASCTLLCGCCEQWVCPLGRAELLSWWYGARDGCRVVWIAYSLQAECAGVMWLNIRGWPWAMNARQCLNLPAVFLFWSSSTLCTLS